MKLLIVSQYFWPEDFRINELALALKDRGHTVTILTSFPNYPQGVINAEYAANPAAFDAYNGLEVIRVPQMMRGSTKLRLMANYMSFALSASVFGAWKLRKRPFDAVFVFQTSPVTVGIPGGVIARLKRAPMIMWILDCWPETLSAIGVGGGRFAQAAIGWLVRAIYASATLLLGQSEGFRQNVERYGRAEKFRHFPNWVEAHYQPSIAPAQSGKPLQAPHKFVVVYAGNIGEAQDFPAIAAAADLLRNDKVEFLIVGDGRDLDRSKADITERGLEANIRFVGRYPPSQMQPFFDRADALLVSLKADPLFALTVPGKVQTYLAAGKPIVGMLDGEGKAVIHDAQAGLIAAAGDSAGLAEAIRAIQRLPVEDRERLGQSGRAYAQEKYERDTLIGRLEVWLSGAVQRHHNCRSDRSV
jgi:colanic acid biosynthesis glycosyl transferase WcaI